jgi:uncharacterized iron-regulated membrane protein
VTLAIDRGDGGRPDLRSQLTLDAATGAVIRWEPFSSYNRGRQFRAWARFTHTGEAFGLLSQSIAVTASAGASLLVFTGLSLALRRFAGWKARGRNRREQQLEESGAVRSNTASAKTSKIDVSPACLAIFPFCSLLVFPPCYNALP